MNFLIVGANFYNKGAQLMLLSSIAALKQRFPGGRICVSPTIGTKEEIDSLGVEILDYPLFHVGAGKTFERYFKFGSILRFFRKDPQGTIKWKDVDAIFDISGFAFSDQWGVRPVKNLNILLDGALKNHSKYIFMPQAFGPFEKEGMKQYMTQVLEKAHLVFPRDRISYEYVMSLVNDPDKIKIAPDITLTYGSKTNELDKYCCVIPNGRILDRGSQLWVTKYKKLLHEAVEKICRETELEVKVLIHDTGKLDNELAQKIVEKNDSDRVKIVTEENPLKLKEAIAQSQFVIGSRFHSLASALSSNVPSLALGWSHKYTMLFENYGVAEYSFLEPDPKIMERLDTLLNPGKRAEIRTQLQQVNETVKAESEKMWAAIGEKL
ncbi:polysaccharide pyruvyl transferase family protein [Phormidium sp. CCY1219]|uniref:polysaccharide pyruvyl transferase family protein n=1 Tax=Phormidium sp. CCY1219 TaxID=2886104 RepID=UPI002D1EBBD4|nr:polysaccharide pyruvyl transferase family protein [Phormidium sp. CCY1219]MEB3829840.1 polysaccharide pyruvyl transferase family protein [Phormidium sp. CCY1219]